MEPCTARPYVFLSLCYRLYLYDCAVCIVSIEWTKDERFGITWNDGQLLPDPNFEIRRDEFLELMFCDSFGLDGIGFGQYFLPDRETADQVHIDRLAEPLWSTQFFWRTRYGLAVARRYVNISGDFYEKAVMHGWTKLVTVGTANVQILRYFRIGCKHNVQTLHVNYENYEWCNDCKTRWQLPY